MSEEQVEKRRRGALVGAQAKKWYRRGVIAGAVLGLLCHLLPPEYQAACHAVVTVCTGGL